MANIWNTLELSNQKGAEKCRCINFMTVMNKNRTNKIVM